MLVLCCLEGAKIFMAKGSYDIAYDRRKFRGLAEVRLANSLKQYLALTRYHSYFIEFGRSHL